MSNILTSKLAVSDFNKPNFKMVGGLTLDKLKIRYIWFLNAEVKDAIIGEDDNGLVWYSGTWINGIWEGGTWYSGIWYDGRWKGGDFYSYDLDKTKVMLGNLYIKREDITKSQFLGGRFESGTFHYGIFGRNRSIKAIPHQISKEFIINNIANYNIVDGEYVDEYDKYLDENVSESIRFKSPEFINGQFINGWMNASKFKGGVFRGGYINNTMWFGGELKGGIFLGDIWYDGTFSNGDFSNGVWEGGKMYRSKFGTCYNIDYVIYEKNNEKNIYYKPNNATWNSGEFHNGEFHSKINLKDNIPIESIDNGIVNWNDGTFYSGNWYGGTFNNGIWENGNFLNGVIYDITFNDGYIKNCLCLGGTFNGGATSSGLFYNTTNKNRFGINNIETNKIL